jgi:hypothetical protein
VPSLRIVDMVDERIAAGGAALARIAASLVDVILRVPKEEQAQLMAHTRLVSSEERR